MTAVAQCLRLQTASQCGENPFKVQTAHSHLHIIFWEQFSNRAALWGCFHRTSSVSAWHALAASLCSSSCARSPSSAVQVWSDMPSTLQSGSLDPSLESLAEHLCQHLQTGPQHLQRHLQGSAQHLQRQLQRGHLQEGPPTSARGTAATSATSATSARTAAATSKATFAMRNPDNWKVLLWAKAPYPIWWNMHDNTKSGALFWGRKIQ